MKLNTNANTLHTNVQSESENFGIGNASVVIDILRNRLYENKIQTLVQEYICNARDAMREVGKPEHAFEINIPTESMVLNNKTIQTNPVFKVKDYGPGISPDRMKNIFIMYGASTKRDSNKQTGGFGIGAKSAWAYTDSFTIVSCYEGMKRTYVAHTGSDSMGSLKLLSEFATNETNGCEIQIAVKAEDCEAFLHAVDRCIYFWNDKPTLNYSNPESKPIGVRFGDIEVFSKINLPNNIVYQYSDDCVAIIDGVAYSIGRKLLEKCPNMEMLRKACHGRVVMYMPNGLVEVSASRESISDSEVSLKALNSYAFNQFANLSNYIKHKFGNSKSVFDWLATYQELSKTFVCEKHKTYDNYRIELDLLTSSYFKDLTVTAITDAPTRKRRGRDRFRNKSDMSSDTDKVFKTEWKNDGIPFGMPVYYNTSADNTRVVNKRIKELFKTTPKFMFIEADNTRLESLAAFQHVIKDLNAKDLGQIGYVDTPREKKEVIPHDQQDICVRPIWGSIRYIDPSDHKTTYVYYPMKGSQVDRADLTKLQAYFDLTNTNKYTICSLGDKAIKQVENNRMFIPLNKFLVGFNPDAKDLATVKYLSCKNHQAICLSMPSKTINNKLINEMISEYKSMEIGYGNEYPTMLKNVVATHADVVTFCIKDAQLSELREKLKLLDAIPIYNADKNVDEIVNYINSKV